MTRSDGQSSAVGTNGYTSDGRRDYFASCACGWLETGWPNEGRALGRLIEHQREAHPPEPLHEPHLTSPPSLT